MSGPLPPPEGNLEAHFAPQEIAMADRALRIAAVGDEAQIEAQLRALIARYRPDEVLLTGHIFDQTARRESFRIGAQVMARINAEG